MRRLLGLFLAGSTIAISVAACNDDSGLYGYTSPAYGGSCRSYTSCDTCTPVAGCGWCFVGNKGACVAHPDECAGVSAFSWTWDVAGCHVGADASTGRPPDGSAPEASVPTQDASANEDVSTAPPEADASAE